jgi:hypothetical protein
MVAVWGCWVYGTEGTRHGVAINETKTNYVQAVNYQTLEHSGRDEEQKQGMNNPTPFMQRTKYQSPRLLPTQTHIAF